MAKNSLSTGLAIVKGDRPTKERDTWCTCTMVVYVHNQPFKVWYPIFTCVMGPALTSSSNIWKWQLKLDQVFTNCHKRLNEIIPNCAASIAFWCLLHLPSRHYDKTESWNNESCTMIKLERDSWKSIAQSSGNCLFVNKPLSMHFMYHVSIIVISQCSAQLLIIHSRLVFSPSPLLCHLLWVVQFKFTILSHPHD